MIGNSLDSDPAGPILPRLVWAVGFIVVATIVGANWIGARFWPPPADAPVPALEVCHDPTGATAADVPGM